MRNFFYAALAAVCALVAAPVAADSGTLTFTPPTTYTNGTALPAAQIASYNLQCSSFTPTGTTTPGTCPAITPATLPGNATGGTITLTIPATGGTACFRVQTVASNGQASAWSNEGCKAFNPLTPNPPTGVTIAVVLGINIAPVYSVTATNKLSALVGFVDLGVQCGDAVLVRYRGTDFREVPRDAVRWWGTTKLRVAAPCGSA